MAFINYSHPPRDPDLHIQHPRGEPEPRDRIHRTAEPWARRILWNRGIHKRVVIDQWEFR